MAELNAPLFFAPIYKSKIWGGKKLQTVLGKDFGDLPNCGESWEISGVPGNMSVVDRGPLAGESLQDLIDRFGAELLGESVLQRFSGEFPLLIKFIDANDDLSIQVHPDDELAKARHGSLGKTEMWYIMQADPGATLISGFNRTLDQEQYQQALAAGKLPEVLNREEAQAGDVFFLPAGRVHTIGKGLLLAEIQQSSDVTYRIYDFDRVDAEGNRRELHNEAALAAIDYQHYDQYKTPYQPQPNEAVELVSCPYFETSHFSGDQPWDRDLSQRDSFTILVCVDGEARVVGPAGSETLQMGQACLIPASVPRLTIQPHPRVTLLETYVPPL